MSAITKRPRMLTPETILGPVREMFGGDIDLDPCTDEENWVRAKAFYSPPEDGCSLSWDYPTVFCNPPPKIACAGCNVASKKARNAKWFCCCRPIPKRRRVSWRCPSAVRWCSSKAAMACRTEVFSSDSASNFRDFASLASSSHEIITD